MVTACPLTPHGDVDVKAILRVFGGIVDGACKCVHEMGKSHVVVVFQSIQDAVQARDGLLQICDSGVMGGGELLGTRKWVVRFAQMRDVPQTPPRLIGVSSSLPAKILVPGMALHYNVLSEEAEQVLLHTLDKQEWSRLIGRKVLHYGFTFDYERRDVDRENKLDAFPSFVEDLLRTVLRPVLQRIFDEFGGEPDQVTVNQYLPGQGIAPHVDTHCAFEGYIVSLSLGSACVMDMRDVEGAGNSDGEPARLPL